ncbi:MAG: SGNH/GDSL hydrolase family protein [Vicinamibacteria bacterium]
MSPPGALRRLLSNLGLALASLAFCFLAGEIALRAIGYAPLRQRPIYRVSDKGDLEIRENATILDCYSSNPRGYFQLDLRQPATREAWARRGLRDLEKVAQSYPFCVEFAYNGLGFREKQVGPKPAGARRVAFVGDSFTEAMGIRESDGYVRVVERLLNRPGGSAWETRNFGRRGYDFPALLESFELALAAEPDVVVYAMVLNDGDRSQALDRRWPRLDDWVMVRRPIAAPGPLDSRLLTLVGERYEAFRISRDTVSWYRALYSEEQNRDGWERTRAHLRRMRGECRGHGVRFMVALWPLIVGLDGRYPLEDVHARLGGELERLRIPHVDLLPALRGRSSEALAVHPADLHPNELGHTLAAAAIAPAIEKLMQTPVRP